MRRRLPLSNDLLGELGPVRSAKRIASSPRSRVWKAEAGRTPVVVKQIIGRDGAYEREVAGLTLAARAEKPVAPRLIARDDERRTLVLEYVDARTPDDDWVVAYAEGLARLHATTTPDDAGALPRWRGPDDADVEAFLELAHTLDVTVTERAAEELEGLAARLGRLGGHALLHGDPCPPNDLHTADGIRLVDFEQASLGDGVTELAYLRIGFPTCWCVTTVPEPLLVRAEAAYRAAAPRTAGDLADACAGWLIRGDALVQRAHRGAPDLLRRAVRKDWRWGTVTARERLAYRLGVVAELAEGHDRLPEFGALCAALRARVLGTWPDLRPPPSRRPHS